MKPTLKPIMQVYFYRINQEKNIKMPLKISFGSGFPLNNR